MEPLTERNWRLFLARHYDNPQCCGETEFLQDLKRLKYLKKAVTRYEKTGELRERRILNHIIILCNLFGPLQVVRVLFLKMEEHMRVLKPFLVQLSILPEIIPAIGPRGKHVHSDDVPMDPRVVHALRLL